MSDAVTISLVVTSPLLVAQVVNWLANRANAKQAHEAATRAHKALESIEGKVDGHQTAMMAALTASQKVVGTVATEKVASRKKKKAPK